MTERARRDRNLSVVILIVSFIGMMSLGAGFGSVGEWLMAGLAFFTATLCFVGLVVEVRGMAGRYQP